MNIPWWHSLRFRIALVIFGLEALMLSVVLWQTQSYSNQKARDLIKEQDQVALELLIEESNRALLTLEFSRLTEAFDRAAGNPHILSISLSDQRDIIVASNDPSRLGKASVAEAPTKGTYLRSIEIEDITGPVGELSVLFSSNELTRVYHETVRLGITLGLSGMLMIALAGIGFGHLLTRKLNRLTQHAEKVTRGDEAAPIFFQGRDEVSLLAHTLNRMIDAMRSDAARMHDMAYRDELTGLANRPRFNQRLERAVLGAQQHAQQHALLYLDLDQFKLVNDTCGHDAGDRLLSELSATMSRTLRSRDTLARIGGDEFGVLLEGAGTAEAALVAEKIRSAVAEFRFAFDNKTFHVGVSIGVVMINAQAGDAKQVLSLADMACYAAKEKGRNTVEFASLEDQDLSERSEQMQWVPTIIAAIEEDRFQLMAQHIVHSHNPKLVMGTEMLLRLRLPDGSLQAPAKVIDAAERYDLMPRLDRQVCKLACEALSKGHIGKQGERVFINLSAQTLSDRDFPKYLLKTLEEYELSPERLCFEITETAAINNLSQATAFITQLKARGCLFALDDFGSGMCSFSYLTRLPVDFVKIDGGFTQGMLENPIDESIIKAVADIARRAQFKTIVEFVEKPAQLLRLRTLGVDYIQGFLAHKPQALPDSTAKQT